MNEGQGHWINYHFIVFLLFWHVYFVSASVDVAMGFLALSPCMFTLFSVCICCWLLRAIISHFSSLHLSHFSETSSITLLRAISHLVTVQKRSIFSPAQMLTLIYFSLVCLAPFSICCYISFRSLVVSFKGRMTLAGSLHRRLNSSTVHPSHLFDH